MPYRIEEDGGGKVRVVNALTGKVHARHSTRKAARAQIRLLNALEHNPNLRRRPGRG